MIIIKLFICLHAIVIDNSWQDETHFALLKILNLFPSSLQFFFIKYIFIGVFHTFYYYNIENWVWICWSGQDSNSRRQVLRVENLILSLEDSCPPRVAIHSRNTIVRTYGNPCCWLVEAVTPHAIPHFWPPGSLDYRRELYLSQQFYISVVCDLRVASSFLTLGNGNGRHKERSQTKIFYFYFCHDWTLHARRKSTDPRPHF